MHKVKYLVGLLALLLLSCGDKEAEIPSYIYIDHIDLETESFEGSNLHKITDVWVTIGSDFVGAFELPCKVPILKEGEFDIQLRAGIKLNGISATRSAYTPYAICTPIDLDDNEISTITLKKDSVTNFNAKVAYRKDINFKVVEGFESAGIQVESIELDKIEDTDTIVYSAEMVKTDDATKVREGSYSGVIHLTKERYTVFLTTSEEIDIPGTSAGKYNYLEVDYKTEVDLTIGLWFNDSQQTKMDRAGLRPNTDWNKVYIYVVPEQANNNLSSVNTATKYKPYIRATLPEGMDEAYIYIDNFKLIHEHE